MSKEIYGTEAYRLFLRELRRRMPDWTWSWPPVEQACALPQQFTIYATSRLDGRRIEWRWIRGILDDGSGSPIQCWTAQEVAQLVTELSRQTRARHRRTVFEDAGLLAIARSSRWRLA